MTRVNTYPYDTADYLETEQDIAAFAEHILDEGDDAILAQAVRAIIRAHGLRSLAASTGLERRAIIEALSGEDANGPGNLKQALVETANSWRRIAAE